MEKKTKSDFPVFDILPSDNTAKPVKFSDF